MSRFRTSALLLVLVGASPPARAQSLAAAERLASMCDFEGALKALDSAPAVERAVYREVPILKARVLIQLNRPREAIEVLNRLRVSADQILKAEQLLLTRLAHASAGDVEKARISLDAAKAAGADREIADGAYGMALAQAGRLDEAEQTLRSVLMREPLLSGALYNLGAINARRGRIAEAAALVRMSWHAGLTDAKQLATDPDLERLRTTPGLIDDLLKAPSSRCGTY